MYDREARSAVERGGGLTGPVLVGVLNLLALPPARIRAQVFG